ncbi:MAG TPA: hypothetical protein VF937_06575 [Chloroflexota bacterium]
MHAAVAQRLTLLLDSCGGLVADFGRAALSAGYGPLSAQPHSLTSVLVPGACLSAGGAWQTAVWPAVGAECMMAAADLFDDAADADPATAQAAQSPAVMLTAAAGLLSLASSAVLRVTEDGADAQTALALARLLGEGFSSAANGQAANLRPHLQQIDALTAYRQAAAKSGPLGSLITRLGARTATDDASIVDLLGQFGWHLAVRSQLANDARDAAPNPRSIKADIRAGAGTVPLAFTGSSGAPPGLNADELADWEQQERQRVTAGGGLVAAWALAEAERLRAAQALDTLEAGGCPVTGLRLLIEANA